MKEKSDYLLSLMKHKAYDFPNGVTVYHSQPGGISKEDLLNMLPCLFSPEELEAERKKLAEEKFEEELLKAFKQAFCV
jgi:hypothetical protein